MADPAGTSLSVDSVTKTFRVHQERATSLKQFIATGGRNRYEEFDALRDVSFDVADGEAVGIIGHNGSGKSTLLKCMARILTPNAGDDRVNKRMSALLELGAGFHPELSGRDNVFLNAAILGHDAAGDRRCASTRSSTSPVSNSSSTRRSRPTRRACTSGSRSPSRSTSIPSCC